MPIAPSDTEVQGWFNAIPVGEPRTTDDFQADFGVSASTAKARVKAHIEKFPLDWPKLPLTRGSRAKDFIAEYLRQIPDGEQCDFSALDEVFPASTKTLRKHLNDYFGENPSHLNRIIGFMPSAEIILNLVRPKLPAKITGANLVEANAACKLAVDQFLGQRHSVYLKKGLLPILQGAPPLDDLLNQLVKFAFHSYRMVVAEEANSTTSLGGTLNELLLIEALMNEGMVLGEDFDYTGKGSAADLTVNGPSKTAKETLYIEVKSYHSRERLLRALTDAPKPKVGVGFFKQPKEFGPRAVTNLLNEGGAKAVYLPDETLQQVAQESRDITMPASKGGFLRPLTSFPAEMKQYRLSGVIG